MKSHSRLLANHEFAWRSCDDTLEFGVHCKDADSERARAFSLLPRLPAFVWVTNLPGESDEVYHASLSAMRKIAPIDLKSASGSKKRLIYKHIITMFSPV